MPTPDASPDIASPARLPSSPDGARRPWQRALGAASSSRSRVLALIVMGGTWAVVRFLALAASPPGFFMDEATPAAHAMCLAQTGRNLDAEAWPLYSHAAGGGHHPLTLLAFDTVWMRLFGTSRAAFRAVSGFWILVTALGLFGLAREVGRRIPRAPDDDQASRAIGAFPWLVLLAALLSPWGFQFSRVAWEAPIAPACLVVGIYALLRSDRGDSMSLLWAALAGACATAAMITYPPMRAVAPLVYFTTTVLLLVVAPGWRLRWISAKAAVVAGLVTLIGMSQTLLMLGHGKINERMNNIAIWRPDFVQEHIGHSQRWIFYVGTFLDNVAAHLRPSFLFFTGDTSMRHSPGIWGELSALDMLAVALALTVVGSGLGLWLRGGIATGGRTPNESSPTLRWLALIACVALLGGFFGVVPAALTFDALPHALRAIGAWPFIALFTGAVLAIAWVRLPRFGAILAITGSLYTVYYLPSYFHAYDGAEKYWFMREMTDLLDKQRADRAPKPISQAIAENMAYSYEYDEVPEYYLMSEAGMGCDEALAAVRAYRAKESEK